MSHPTLHRSGFKNGVESRCPPTLRGMLDRHFGIIGVASPFHLRTLNCESRLVQSPFMANLSSVLQQLEQERTRLASQLASLNTALSALNGNGSTRRGRMSAAGRARVAAAQRARWAKVKGRKVVSIASRKRAMSPVARKRIVGAQKARRAKWRKAQKAGSP